MENVCAGGGLAETHVALGGVGVRALVAQGARCGVLGGRPVKTCAALSPAFLQDSPAVSWRQGATRGAGGVEGSLAWV